MHILCLTLFQSLTNSFQGVFITDFATSYAVFIYECGGMEWGGGVIGWKATDSHYAAHPLSGQPNSSDIGCLHFPSYSAEVYRISR